jgi:N-acetylmuramoyl-L-alanine amidase
LNSNNQGQSDDFVRYLAKYIPDICKVEDRTCENSELKILEINAPAVLIKIGNISNRVDNNLLYSRIFREKLNCAIVYALDEFFKTRK